MNPAMAGLGALTKQTSQPTGKSPESMSQTMALAKQMSDMQLADVLAGKSMNIPQYVAMTEAMGRKQLRTAMQGMTAMTSAKQPTEREKLLSEMMPRQPQPSIMNAPPQGAGLDQLPADNMQGLGHANGGIIAFSGKDKDQVVAGGVAVPEGKAEDPDWLQKLKDWVWVDPEKVRNNGKTNAYEYPALGNVIERPIPLTPSSDLPQSITAFPKDRPSLAAPPPVPAPRSSILVSPFEDVGTGTASSSAPAAAPSSSAPAATPKIGAGPSTGSGPGGGGPGGGGPGGSLAGTDLSRFAEKQAELLRPRERNKDYYEALTRPTEDIAKQVASGKEQAQGEFLMNIGAALMSTPNLGVALSKGVQAGLPGLAASRKEINALTKDQRDYQFNIAKAKEARDQGDEMLALNYLKLAEESKYNAGRIGAAMARASGSGSSDKLMQQLNIAATNLTNKQWETFVKAQGFRGSKLTAADQAAFFKKNFPSNLSMMSGEIPEVDDDSDVFEKPGGPLRTRSEK
jgi:hypothetical protein